jgi:hypothetical protein
MHDTTPLTKQADTPNAHLHGQQAQHYSTPMWKYSGCSFCAMTLQTTDA